MNPSNYITKVAIVGAGGNSGRFMTEALLKTGKHTVTAITRADSQNELPDGVVTKKVDYEQMSTLVDALKGQDALVITLGGMVPSDTDMKLIQAAGEAGVSWILPNEWAPDTTNEELIRDVVPFQAKPGTRKAIEDLGKSAYISVLTGFWFEWSVGIKPAFGFDFTAKCATFFDDGETKISVSTWPQVGRAVASLLSLPIRREGGNKKACLEDYKNRVVYVNSFTVSQKDMLASALRVTGAKEEDWTVVKEGSKERYEEGLKETGEGNRVGFVKMMYTRVFYPDGNGDFESAKGTLNEALGLPKENMDEAMERGIARSKQPQWYDA
ncbi:hypothetical protein F5Y15DRAFT_412265 [Xylariaceae sp. FL0016]|nr:hypothetical protein F5Y15DRAFT_412265 [Xylariaceae sp. FL0016]